MTRRLTTALAGLALALTAGTPAMADPPIGSRIDRSDRGLTQRFNPRRAESARPAINAFFRCKASLDVGGTNALLGLAYMSEEQKAMIDRIGPSSQFSDDRREDCFSNFGGDGVQIGYDPVSAVGGFSEYFFVDGFDADDAARLGSLTREDWQTPGLTPRNGSEMIGMCTAQAAGADVFRLIESAPESPAEASAIAALVPYLGPCLTEGVEVSFDASSLRAMLAHSLFRALTGMRALEKANS